MREAGDFHVAGGSVKQQDGKRGEIMHDLYRQKGIANPAAARFVIDTAAPALFQYGVRHCNKITFFGE